MTRPYLAFLLTFTGSIATASAQQVGHAPPTSGDCRNIIGLPSVSTTVDDGMTWSTNRRRLEFGNASFGFAVLDTGEWVTEFQGKLYVSDNACRWRRLGNAPTSLLRLAPGVGSQALAWEFIPGPQIWRIDTSAAPNAVEPLAFLPTDVLTVAVDPADADRMRAVGRNGRIYESAGAGNHWNPVGNAAPVTPLTYFAAIDPHDMDHVIIGMAVGGTVVTFDGGSTWTFGAGLSSTGGSFNGFNGVISPASSSLVWVMGFDFDEAASGHPSGGKHVYRSDDGGLTFVPVLDQGNGIVLTNGPVMAPHPTDTDVLYFPFGSRFLGTNGGVNLYRYDHGSGGTTWNFSPDFFQIRALRIDPANPDRVVAGFEG